MNKIYKLVSFILIMTIIGCNQLNQEYSNSSNVKYEDPETTEMRKKLRERLKKDSIFEATASMCDKLVKHTNMINVQNNIKNCNGTVRDLMALIKINDEIFRDTIAYANCKNFINENALVINVANSNAYKNICSAKIVNDTRSGYRSGNDSRTGGGAVSSMHFSRGSFGTANAFRSTGF